MFGDAAERRSTTPIASAISREADGETPRCARPRAARASRSVGATRRTAAADTVGSKAGIWTEPISSVDRRRPPIRRPIEPHRDAPPSTWSPPNRSGRRWRAPPWQAGGGRAVVAGADVLDGDAELDADAGGRGDAPSQRRPAPEAQPRDSRSSRARSRRGSLMRSPGAASCMSAIDRRRDQRRALRRQGCSAKPPEPAPAARARRWRRAPIGDPLRAVRLDADERLKVKLPRAEARPNIRPRLDFATTSSAYASLGHRCRTTASGSTPRTRPPHARRAHARQMSRAHEPQ